MIIECLEGHPESGTTTISLSNFRCKVACIATTASFHRNSPLQWSATNATIGRSLAKQNRQRRCDLNEKHHFLRMFSQLQFTSYRLLVADQLALSTIGYHFSLTLTLDSGTLVQGPACTAHTTLHYSSPQPAFQLPPSYFQQAILNLLAHLFRPDRLALSSINRPYLSYPSTRQAPLA